MFHPDFASNYSINDLESIFDKHFHKVCLSKKDIENMYNIFVMAKDIQFESIKQYTKFMTEARKKLKLPNYSKIKLTTAYRQLVNDKRIRPHTSILPFMSLKSARGSSGVFVITTFMSGTQMGKSANESLIKSGGCPMDCHYCPFEKDENGIPTQPRSYLSTEPGNMRATQNKHHPVGQTIERLYQLEHMGHISADPSVPNKCEFIISGGTFNFFPKEYIIWYVTCTYYACNIYYGAKQNILPEMRSLKEEQAINEKSSVRIIGLTIETRPDYVAPIDKKNPDKVNLKEIEFMLELGVTRIQIGVQHTDDSILKKVNRKCTSRQNKEGIRYLKQNGIKTDIHIMFDLPGTTPEKDIACIDEIVDNPDYQADQWKLYPTETTNFTKIKQWYDDKLYLPYAEDNSNGLAYNLVKVIKHALTRVPPYVRVNRVVRDIPHKSIEGGLKCGNLRQMVHDVMNKQGIYSQCIRNREVKLKHFDQNDICMFSRKYISSGGIEYFISYESRDTKTLYGFVRLRLNITWDDVLPHMHGYAFIRELHMYGRQQNVSSYNKFTTQHKGLGGNLLHAAEEIAYRNGYRKIAVISGVGARGYYRKKGYKLYYTYMVKELSKYMFNTLVYRDLQVILGISCLILSVYCYLQI